MQAWSDALEELERLACSALNVGRDVLLASDMNTVLDPIVGQDEVGSHPAQGRRSRELAELILRLGLVVPQLQMCRETTWHCSHGQKQRRND